MQFLVHVGPHKTATTSIQWHLHDCTTQLSERGVWYPLDRYPNGAQHAIAWQILNRDVTALGITGEFPSWEARLSQWIQEAADKGCHKLMLSSESFSKFTLSQWDLFGNFLKKHSPGPFSLRLISALRDPIDIAKSSYSTYLLHGGSQDFSEYVEPTANRYRRFYSVMEELPRHFGESCEVISIPYVSDGDGQFVPRWFNTVFGRGAWEELFPNGVERRENIGLSEEMQEQLLAFNKQVNPHVVINRDGLFDKQLDSVINHSMRSAGWFVQNVNQQRALVEEIGRRDSEIRALQTQLDHAQTSEHVLRQRVIALDSPVEKLQERVKDLRRQNQELRNSRSFRLGQAFLRPFSVLWKRAR
jgi:hypothetical protein